MARLLKVYARSGRFLMASVVAISAAYTLATFCQTFFVLTALSQAGAELPVMVWFQTFLQDLYGLAFQGRIVSFALIVIVGFMVVLPITAIVRRVTGLPGALLYVIAGGAVMVGILLLSQAFFYNLHLYAGTRTLSGFVSQVLAGGLGGLTFWRLTPKGAVQGE